MPAPPPTRIYHIECVRDGREILVRAARASTAKQHASGNDYRARVATQRDLERLIRDGVEVQEAAHQPEDKPGDPL